jgi:deoxyuridine 5'-triphosphate nucleotidohydrolase
MELEVPVFKFVLNEGLSDIFLPVQATATDTGWDVKSTENLSLASGQYVKINLGFRVFAPQGWWLELRPRSSSFAKKYIHALYGVIDEAYQGQCVFAGQYLPDTYNYNRSPNNLIIKIGDAIGQLVPFKRQEMKVERVSNEEFEKLCKERNATRGAGGFGSTG